MGSVCFWGVFGGFRRGCDFWPGEEARGGSAGLLAVSLYIVKFLFDCFWSKWWIVGKC